MRGGGHARRLGNAAEAFVIDLLRQGYSSKADGGLVTHLQQDQFADIVAVWLFPEPGWMFYEVKSSKTRRRALSARLSPAEQEAFDWMYPEHYQVIRVLRIPGNPDRYEVLSRDA